MSTTPSSMNAAVPQTPLRGFAQIRRYLSRVLCVGALQGVLVVTPGFAKTTPAPTGQALDECVELNSAWPECITYAARNGSKSSANGRDGIVVLLTPVAAQTQPVAQGKSQKEDQQARQAAVYEIKQISGFHTSERNPSKEVFNFVLLALTAFTAGLVSAMVFGFR